MESEISSTRMYEYSRDAKIGAECWHTHNNTCMAHFHSSLEMVWVRSGVMHAMLDAHPCTVPAGHLLMVTSYTLHTYQTWEENDVTVITVPLSSIPSMQNQLRDNAFASSVYNAAADARLISLLTLIDEGFETYNPETRIGLCHALLGMLVSSVGLVPLKTDSHHGMMRNVLMYLQENYQYNLTPAALADHFGYSKSRFSHLFNETLGCSIGTIVNRLRCQRAAQELLESKRTILDISMDVGFSCSRTFYRVFKRFYGMTPTEYVQKHSILNASGDTGGSQD